MRRTRSPSGPDGPSWPTKINAEHRNPDYFPTIPLPESLQAVSDPQQAIEGAEFVVLAVPSQSLRANLADWSLPEAAIVVSLAKGIELGTGLRMSEVIAEAGGVVRGSDRGGHRAQPGPGDR